MSDFENNFQTLKDHGVIPDLHADTLPPNVRDVISALTQDELDVLKKISDGTGSHLSLQNKKYHFSVCGL